MADDADIAQDRTDADLERVLASRQPYQGESAEECTECGNPIPEPRRQAITTELCVECAAAAERQ